VCIIQIIVDRNYKISVMEIIFSVYYLDYYLIEIIKSELWK